LFGMYALNAHLPRNVTSCSSMVPYGDAVCILLQLPAKTSVTSRSVAKCHGIDSYQQDRGGGGGVVGGRPVTGRGLWNEISKEFVPHTPHKIFQDRICHIKATSIPTRKPETWSLVTRAQIFVIFWKQSIKILLTCCII
jgi:hypothetical protein